MKKILFVFCIISFLSSCSKDAVYPTVMGKTWKVSLYTRDKKDETPKFAGYAFEFKTGGTFTANYTSSNPVNGTWKLTESSKELIIAVSGNDKLDDVSKDWEIISITDTSIKLTGDINSTNEVLEFVKN